LRDAAVVGGDDRTYGRTMLGQLSPGEREFATLVDQLRALEEDIAAARRPPRPMARRPEEAPDLSGERVALSDGAQIVVRPIGPGDADDLVIGFERLGALSRYRLFGESISHLTRQQLFDLTHVDHKSREVLAAFDPATGEGVGLASYVRLPDDPACAEVACTVLDGWQHRGVGTILAGRLAERARAAGVERCTALVILGNEPARRLLAHVAGDRGELRTTP
jgi:GNAT superfamily N-acetyltransferase